MYCIETGNRNIKNFVYIVEYSIQPNFVKQSKCNFRKLTYFYSLYLLIKYSLFLLIFNLNIYIYRYIHMYINTSFLSGHTA